MTATTTREITAAVVRDKGTFELPPALLEPPREEVLVRIVTTGLCHTHLVVRDQVYPVPLPVVLGHEGAGVVEAVGAAVQKVPPGDHVAVSFLPCGHCRPGTVPTLRRHRRVPAPRQPAAARPSPPSSGWS